MNTAKLFLITDNGVYSSSEFYGDMGMNELGLGSEIVRLLKRVNSAKGFKKEVENLCKEKDFYDSDKVHKVSENNNYMFDIFLDNEVEHSDWSYVRNITDVSKTIHVKNGTFVLQPGWVLVAKGNRHYEVFNAKKAMKSKDYYNKVKKWTLNNINKWFELLQFEMIGEYTYEIDKAENYCIVNLDTNDIQEFKTLKEVVDYISVSFA